MTAITSPPPARRPVPEAGYVIDAEGRGARAVDDLRRGFLNAYLWSALGWHDIRARYRRAVLGPLWLTLSLAIMTLAISVLFGGVFGQDLHVFLPYVASGLVAWGLISGTLLDGCNAYIHHGDLARNLTLPLSTHVLRAVWRNLIILGHNALVLVALAPFTAFKFNAATLLLLPGLALVVLNLTWAALVLAVLSLRLRDLPLLFGNLLSLLFLLTPVFWTLDALPARLSFVALNPLFALVDLFRAPLLGEVARLSSWVLAVLGAAIGVPLAVALYRRVHWRLAYWL